VPRKNIRISEFRDAPSLTEPAIAIALLLWADGNILQ